MQTVLIDLIVDARVLKVYHAHLLLFLLFSHFLSYMYLLSSPPFWLSSFFSLHPCYTFRLCSLPFILLNFYCLQSVKSNGRSISFFALCEFLSQKEFLVQDYAHWHSFQITHILHSTQIQPCLDKGCSFSWQQAYVLVLSEV